MYASDDPHGEHLCDSVWLLLQLVVRFCLGDVEEHFDALLAEEKTRLGDSSERYS